MNTYKRWQIETIKEALKYRRVLILTGARQCGKTTLAKELELSNIIYRTLDSSQILESALIDPEGFVAHNNELMIIDEIQRAPLLLLSIKKMSMKIKSMDVFY
jgi:predicted AAA+ superfamily ATPase